MPVVPLYDIFARDGEPGISVLTMSFSYTLPARAPDPAPPLLARLAARLRRLLKRGSW